MSIFRQPIHYNQDHILAFRNWQSFNEIHANFSPFHLRYWERCKQTRVLDMFYLGNLTNRALSHLGSYVSLQIRPKEELFNFV
jgi:diadenosine tetraphosphate (Ap4A) HIT family hydrolase